MAELKPCKCEKRPEYYIKPWGAHIEYIYVCPTCKHFGVGLSDEQAIDAWNKRS